MPQQGNSPEAILLVGLYRALNDTHMEQKRLTASWVLQSSWIQLRALIPSWVFEAESFKAVLAVTALILISEHCNVSTYKNHLMKAVQDMRVLKSVENVWHFFQVVDLSNNGLSFERETRQVGL